MNSFTTKKDYLLVSVIGVVFGIFVIPVMENINPAFWELNFLSVLILITGFFAFANLAFWLSALIEKIRKGFLQFSRYAAIGSMNASLDIGIFNLLSFAFQVFAGPLIIVFNILSFSVAVTNSYFWNNLWAFKRDGAILKMSEYFRFVGITIVGVGINTIIVYILTTVTGSPEGVSPQLWENVAKIIAAPPTVAWNFIGYKFFVFANKPVAKNNELV